MTSFERLVHYALAKGLVVHPGYTEAVKRKAGPHSQACLVGGKIYIRCSGPKSYMPYYLAHEIGHYLDAENIARSKGFKELRAQHRRYAAFRQARQAGRKPRTSDLLTARAMEIRATAIGAGLMRHLGLRINVKILDTVSVQNLRNYV